MIFQKIKSGYQETLLCYLHNFKLLIDCIIQ